MIAMVFAWACAQEPDARQELLKRQIDEAVALLAKESAAEYQIGRLTLVDLGRAAEPRLVDLVATHKSAQVRTLACDILGEIRAASPAAAAALKARLTDDEYFGTSVASRAARALGLIGDASAAPELTAALKTSLEKNDVALRYESILALGRLRSIEAIGEIRARLADKAKTDSGLRIDAAAIQALVMLEARGAVEDLAAALDTNEPDEWGLFPGRPVSQVAVWALERLLDKSQWPSEAKRSIVDAAESERAMLAQHWRNWRADRKRVAETRASLEAVAAAVEAYRKETGKLPSKLADLIGEAKKYVESEEKLKDGWGTLLVYRVPGWGADYSLTSLGADKQQGGAGLAADLWSNEAWKEQTRTRTIARLREIGKALEAYKEKNGALPPTLEALKEKGDYTGEITDAWEKPLRYVPGADGTFSLVSLGYDGKDGGEEIDADIDLKKLPQE
jgi:type II secretory pathway pseudopilin PulG